MWDVPEFKAWLGQTFGDPSLWESLILPAMKHIVICTSKCAQVRLLRGCGRLLVVTEFV